MYVIATLFSTGLIRSVVAQTIRYVTIRVEKTSFIYDKALLYALKTPTAFLIWFLGIIISCSLISSYKAEFFIVNYLPQIKNTGIAFVLCWISIRFIRQIEAFYLSSNNKRQKEIDKTFIHALAQFLNIIVFVLGLLVIMQILGIPIAGLLAFGGIGGAGIAFAAKELLANFFGGLIIHMDKPFKVGDWIRSPDKNIEGIVEHIGWRVTRIRTFEKRPLYVPNGVFLTISVENSSRMLNRRIKTNIGVRYQDADKINAITKQIRQMLLNHEGIDTTQTVAVHLVEFGTSSLNIMVYAFTKTINWVDFQTIQHEIFMNILSIYSENDAECALPTQTLHLHKTQSMQ